MPKPKQEELKAKISLEKDIFLGLQRKRDTGVLSEHDRERSLNPEIQH